MKKLSVLLVALIICWNLLVYAQPVILPDEPVIVQTVVKINGQTCEITTTTTTETIIQHDRAELQTELDHIPDRLTELQEQIDRVNKRKAELIEILKVFK